MDSQERTMTSDSRIDLDEHFRRGSRAHRMAERLMSGKAMTRQQLAGSPASVTTVNRVVQVLQQQGAIIRRDVVDRQARYQLVGIGEPKARLQPPNLDDPVTVVMAELVGQERMIEIENAAGVRWRGRLSTQQQPQVGARGQVESLTKTGDHDTEAVIAIRQHRYRLAQIHPVSPTRRLGRGT